MTRRGRPPKYTDPGTFDMMVDLYVAACDDKKEPLTIPGLALFLGFSCRQSLYEYQEKEEFTDSIKRARSLVEADMIRRGLATGGAMPIFILKNMGYSDRQTTQIDPIKIVIEGSDARL